ncbi:MAG: response regulator [Anaerolineales bacterium]
MPIKPRVMVVDDDTALLAVMESHLSRQPFDVTGFTDGRLALEWMQAGERVAVLVTDLDMPTVTGLELLREAKWLDPWVEVVVVTGNGTVENAISAMRSDGAFDFLTKPFESLRALSLAVERAATHRQLKLERETLRERLQAVVAHTQDAILSTDAHGVLRVVNRAAADLAKRSDLEGQVALDALPAVLRNVIVNWQAMGEGKPLLAEIPGPGETALALTLTAIPGRIRASEGWVMVIRDITLQKRLDHFKYRALGEMVSKLQTPVAQAMADMAELNGLVADDHPQAADIIFRLIKVWNRIHTWMYDARTLMRVEAGLGVRAVDCELAVTLAEALRTLPKNALREKNVRLGIGLPPALPRLRSDPALLRHLVHALIGRAVLRSEPGGQVKFGVSVQPGQVWLSVSDDGVALSPPELTHLFDKSPRGTGTGPLELPIAKSLVGQLGGQLWVRNHEPAGNTVLVSLPHRANTAELRHDWSQ